MGKFWMMIAVLGFALTGCQPAKPTFNGIDITGATGYATDFRLTDHQGKPRALSDFHGKVVALFFGYTHCPDVCPTTLSEMREVMAKLGPDRDRFQVLFVTVDPERDTQALLAQYVPSFNPAFVGLTGSADEVAKVAQGFRIIARKVPGKTADSYSVDHTAGTLVFDPQGRLRLFFNYGLEADKMAADIKALL